MLLQSIQIFSNLPYKPLILEDEELQIKEPENEETMIETVNNMLSVCKTESTDSQEFL